MGSKVRTPSGGDDFFGRGFAWLYLVMDGRLPDYTQETLWEVGERVPRVAQKNCDVAIRR